MSDGQIANLYLPCKCFVDKCKSFTVKTYGELEKWPNNDEFDIQTIDIKSRYPDIQQIIRETSDEALVSFQVVCLEYNKSLVEIYTFGYDAYRQVVEQLMQIKNTQWKISLESVVDVEEYVSTPRTIPLTSPKVHFDDMTNVTSHYIETFRTWEHLIVALVGLSYTVMYLKINVYV